MTAFAQLDCQLEQSSLQIRIKSVNHRQLKCHVFCGSELELEAWITQRLQAELERGYIELHIDLQSQNRDEDELSDWIQRCQAQNLPVPTWSDLYNRRLNASGSNLSLRNAAKLKPHIDHCLLMFKQRRLEEGEALAKCMLRDSLELNELLKKIRLELPQHHETRAARLKQKLQELLITLDGQTREDLTRECAHMLERLDVQEELDRLETHLTRFNYALAEEARGGRYLDFLCQELHREITTLGNKSQSAQISEWVVCFKTQLEKCREQCQNLE